MFEIPGTLPTCWTAAKDNQVLFVRSREVRVPLVEISITWWDIMARIK